MSDTATPVAVDSIPVQVTPTPITAPALDLRSHILQCDDMQYETIDCPEWGPDTKVTVRSLTAEEKDNFEKSITYTLRERRGRKIREKTKVDPTKLRAKLVVVSACIAMNNPAPLFSPKDVDGLAKKNGAAMDRLFEACQRLSGFSDDDVDDMGKGSSPELS